MYLWIRALLGLIDIAVRLLDIAVGLASNGLPMRRRRGED